MPRSFANQVAVVTGGSSGIGLSLARLLAAEGCKVGLIAPDRETLEAAARQLADAGRTAAVAVADVTQRPQVLAAVEELRRQLGPVDLMVANAGVGPPTPPPPFDTAHVEAVMRVNVLGTAYSVEAVLPEMLQRRQGHLVGMSSLTAYLAVPTHTAYSASKAAIKAYLDGLRRSLRGSGVVVTTICPGFVRTPMTSINKFKMSGLLEPDEAARRILKAVRRRAAVYDFPWSAALTMKLASCLPDWLLMPFMDQMLKPQG